MNTKRAFTLIELLVVIAIIAILAAILFPVFAQAKSAAKKTASISNQKQYNAATHMYLGDNEDTAPIIQYNNTYDVKQGDSNIGVICNPYMKNQDIWTDPMSPVGRQERLTKDLIDPATYAEPYRTQQTIFNLGIKNDYGYNTQYWSVMGANCTVGNQTLSFMAGGTVHTVAADPANTLMYINSDWDRSGDRVVGGGNWGLDMPCRIYADGTDSLPPPPGGCTGRWWWTGWDPGTKNWNEFGGAWPYHSGKAVVGYADSHANVKALSQLARGCDVKKGWTGRIFDKTVYIWDLN